MDTVSWIQYHGYNIMDTVSMIRYHRYRIRYHRCNMVSMMHKKHGVLNMKEQGILNMNLKDTRHEINIVYRREAKQNVAFDEYHQ